MEDPETKEPLDVGLYCRICLVNFVTLKRRAPNADLGRAIRSAYNSHELTDETHRARVIAAREEFWKGKAKDYGD